MRWQSFGTRLSKLARTRRRHVRSRDCVLHAPHALRYLGVSPNRIQILFAPRNENGGRSKFTVYFPLSIKE
ncbi:LOW QUALITY PROTEIN: hypothetical protein TorRG33x02_262580 [Trema orientale]|uniref:Uncharacterized protein n=1 Tax=Trema orientale TaxID=63057 RepID=A0A2P5D4T7_TREOI|nr:LOW QUALITY PROTEIN: hypothetical protein TorRG33x02_262580 [Trema orientale]